MKLKKLFAGLISLAAALLAVCAITVCAGAEWSGDYEYDVLDDGTVEITDYIGSATNLTVPSTIDGKKVTSIGAFAFSRCTSLTSVKVPDGVKSIGHDAFGGSSNFTSITVGDNNEYFSSQDGVLFNKDKTEILICPRGKSGEYIIPDSVTSIEDYAFWYCSSLTSVTIPNSVTIIGFSAFEGCSSLTSITIPNSVTIIGSSAFERCSSLKSIDIPDSITSIEDDAFLHCSSLTSVTIPDSVTRIGDSAFRDCSSLKSINIPDGVTSIEHDTFKDCSMLNSLTIPDSVTNIGYDAFTGTALLKNQTTAVKYAGKWAVACDENATTVSIKSGTVGIAEHTFYTHSNLTSIVIPKGMKYIGIYAFFGCKMSSVTIPDGTEIIEAYAFSHCTNLVSATLPDSIKKIGEDAFVKTPLLDNQTSFVKYAGKWAVSCEDKGDIPWQEEKSSGTDSAATYIDNDNLNVTIKDGTLGIADKAFCIRGNILSVVLPAGVKYIGNEAFSYCTDLKSITIPDSVTNIGNSILYSCTKLNDIYYTGSKAQWNKIAVGEDNDELLNGNIHYNYVTAPSAVTGLKLKGRSGDALRISWTKNTSADGYIIEMKDGSKWVRVGKITKNSTVEFRKDKLKAGTAYSFRVKAYKMRGKTALYSGYTSISARTNPSAVTGLKLKGRSGNALRISWTKNTSADGYIIEMKDGSKWVRVGKVTKNSTVEFRKDKLKAGTAYSFRVKAYKMSGKTALYSGYTTISARTNPSTVSGLKLKNANSNAVRLAWTKNTSADGYIIEMKVNGTWTRVGKVTKNSTVEFRKGSLKSKTSYSFRIKAYKMSGKTALYSGYTTVTVKTK